jgi:hypothetical protein
MKFFRRFPKTSYDFFNRGVRYDIADITRYVNVDKSKLADVSVYTLYNIQDGDRPDIVSTRLYKTPEYHWTFFIINDSLKNGLEGWPMSQTELEQFLEDEYGDGIAITTADSISGKFQVGAEVTINGTVTGTVHSRNVQLNQVVIKGLSSTSFTTGMTIVGADDESTPDTIATKVNYRYAPHHYVNTDDEEVSIVGLPSLTGLTAITFEDVEKLKNDNLAQIQVIKPEFIYNFANTFEELINA